MSTKNILLTGYEPFDQFDFNPSERIALALNGQRLDDGRRIQGAVLPVDSARMPAALGDLIEAFQPELIVGLGLAFGENSIRVETFGHNWIEYNKPDNGGNLEPGRRLVEDGPAAYFTTYRANEIVEQLLKAGIPAYLSSHAGTHMCNYFLYEALHRLHDLNPTAAPRLGFLHLPGTPQMVAQALRLSPTYRAPSMSLELMQQAARLALEVA